MYAPNTTCGWLTSPLGQPQEGEYFPTLQIYVCQKLAQTQPAPKGVLFVHVSGPGTVTDSHYDSVVKNLRFMDYYDVHSINQRGIGRCKPSFANPDCEGVGFTRLGSVTNLTDPEMSMRANLQHHTAAIHKCFN
jgi:hypothetical protein